MTPTSRIRTQFNAIIQRSDWRQGLKTGLAAGICYWLTLKLGFKEGYWAAISSIVVMQSEVGATLISSRDRLAGTAIGAILAWAASLGWHGNAVYFALVVIAAMMIAALLNLKNAGRLAGTAVCIILLVKHDGPNWLVAVHRFEEVAFGIMIALAISVTIWPGSRRAAIRG